MSCSRLRRTKPPESTGCPGPSSVNPSEWTGTRPSIFNPPKSKTTLESVLTNLTSFRCKTRAAGRVSCSGQRGGPMLVVWVGSWSGRLAARQRVADLAEVVGQEAKADPAFHAGFAVVAAAVQSKSSLQHADAALDARPPALVPSKSGAMLGVLLFDRQRSLAR